jgi:hypothetical protein
MTGSATLDCFVASLVAMTRTAFRVKSRRLRCDIRRWPSHCHAEAAFRDRLRRGATRAALRYLKHDSLPDKVILPADIIDKTNYRAWLVPVEQRSCADWNEFVRK